MQITQRVQTLVRIQTASHNSYFFLDTTSSLLQDLVTTILDNKRATYGEIPKDNDLNAVAVYFLSGGFSPLHWGYEKPHAL